MSIVTKTGDKGFTGLVGKGRVSKADPRMHAIGTVDELNALLGIATAGNEFPEDIAAGLKRIQNELFTLGADLASPDASLNVPRITDRDVREMETWIAALEESLPPLSSFILPGGSTGGALLHHARTVCRRAERWVVALQDARTPHRHVQIYLNRLGDLLFLLARTVNRSAGIGEETVTYGS